MSAKQNFYIRRLVVSTVAAIAVLLVFTIAVLAWKGTPIPDALDRLCFSTVGGLIGMLVKMTTDTLKNSGDENKE